MWKFSSNIVRTGPILVTDKYPFLQELSSGHIAYLSACFKNITDALTELNPDTSTLDQLFGLDLHLIIPFKAFILDVVQ